MDKTGVMLSMLISVKVLIGRDNLRKYCGVSVKRTIITAIEYVSGNGRLLLLLIF